MKVNFYSKSPWLFRGDPLTLPGDEAELTSRYSIGELVLFSSNGESHDPAVVVGIQYTAPKVIYVLVCISGACIKTFSDRVLDFNPTSVPPELSPQDLNEFVDLTRKEIHEDLDFNMVQ